MKTIIGISLTAFVILAPSIFGAIYALGFIRGLKVCLAGIALVTIIVLTISLGVDLIYFK